MMFKVSVRNWRLIIVLLSSFLCLPTSTFAAAVVRGGRLQICPSPKSKENFRDLFEEVFFSNANVPALLDYLPQQYTTGTVLVVGSNTMNNSNDPLISSMDKYGAFKKVFVEPIPPLFEQLQKNLAHLPETTFVNAAITSNDEGKGRKKMFCLDMDEDGITTDEALPDWANQICSFDMAHLDKHFKDAEIEEYMVDTLSFSQLLSEHAIRDVVLFVLDVEGYDYEILKQLPFGHSRDSGKFRPMVICFEHHHLSESDRDSALDLLRRNGYAITQRNTWQNTWAIALP